MRGVPKLSGRPHANLATWAFGGAPYGATNRVRGVPKQRHADGRRKVGEEEEKKEEWGRKEECGALSLQNEDPTPQDGWE